MTAESNHALISEAFQKRSFSFVPRRWEWKSLEGAYEQYLNLFWLHSSFSDLFFVAHHLQDLWRVSLFWPGRLSEASFRLYRGNYWLCFSAFLQFDNTTHTFSRVLVKFELYLKTSAPVLQKIRSESSSTGSRPSTDGPEPALTLPAQSEPASP